MDRRCSLAYFPYSLPLHCKNIADLWSTVDSNARGMMKRDDEGVDIADGFKRDVESGDGVDVADGFKRDVQGQPGDGEEGVDVADGF